MNYTQHAIMLRSYQLHLELYNKAHSRLERANLATMLNRIAKRIDGIKE